MCLISYCQQGAVLIILLLGTEEGLAVCDFRLDQNYDIENKDDLKNEDGLKQVLKNSRETQN